MNASQSAPGNSAKQPAGDEAARESRRLSQARELAIESLAKEHSRDVEQVRSLFDIEMTRLESQAKIKTYLTVIATRLVRVALTQEQPVPAHLQ